MHKGLHVYNEIALIAFLLDHYHEALLEDDFLIQNRERYVGMLLHDDVVVMGDEKEIKCLG